MFLDHRERFQGVRLVLIFKENILGHPNIYTHIYYIYIQYYNDDEVTSINDFARNNTFKYKVTT